MLGYRRTLAYQLLLASLKVDAKQTRQELPLHVDSRNEEHRVAVNMPDHRGACNDVHYIDVRHCERTRIGNRHLLVRGQIVGLHQIPLVLHSDQALGQVGR